MEEPMSNCKTITMYNKSRDKKHLVPCLDDALVLLVDYNVDCHESVNAHLYDWKQGKHGLTFLLFVPEKKGIKQGEPVKSALLYASDTGDFYLLIHIQEIVYAYQLGTREKILHYATSVANFLWRSIAYCVNIHQVVNNPLGSEKMDSFIDTPIRSGEHCYVKQTGMIYCYDLQGKCKFKYDVKRLEMSQTPFQQVRVYESCDGSLDLVGVYEYENQAHFLIKPIYKTFFSKVPTRHLSDVIIKV
jgi:hypothetical protein